MSRAKLSAISLGLSVVICAVCAAGAAAAVSKYNVHATEPISTVLTGMTTGAAYRVGGTNMAAGVGFVDGVDESKLTIVYGFTLVAPGQPVLHVTGRSVLHVTEDPYTGELIAFVNDDRFACF